MEKADQRQRRVRLSDESRKLLDTIDELHELEERKRDEDISTPPFHRLADTIKAKADEVFRITNVQEEIGNHIATGDVSLNDIDPEGSHRGEQATDREPAAG